MNRLLEYREIDRVKINGLVQKFNGLDQKFNDFQKFVKKEFLETKNNISKLNNQSSYLKTAIQNGLGTSFEQFNFTWIKQMLINEHPNIQLVQNKRFKDPEKIVNCQSDQFELDIFSDKPKVVVECTTFLNETEKDKVYKLDRVKKYFNIKETDTHYNYTTTTTTELYSNTNTIISINSK